MPNQNYVSQDLRQFSFTDITIDSRAHSRAEMSEKIIQELVEAYRAGAKVPEPVVISNDGQSFWLADGFHRVEAAKRSGRTGLVFQIWFGHGLEPFLAAGAYGALANARHGAKRSNKDKRKAVEFLLRVPGWHRMSSRRIERALEMDHKTVESVREQLENHLIILPPESEPTEKFVPAAMAKLEKHAVEDAWIATSHNPVKQGRRSMRAPEKEKRLKEVSEPTRRTRLSQLCNQANKTGYLRHELDGWVIELRRVKRTPVAKK